MHSGRRFTPPPSTIFDNEYSENGTKIRCGFHYCKCDHSYYSCTEDNIKRLSTHVCFSVDTFIMHEALSDNTLLFSSQPKAAPPLGIFPARWPSKEQLRPSSILCILELDDEKCTLLEWLPGLLRSVYAGSDAYPYIFTRRFHSRKHLLYDILLGEFHKNLSSINTPEYRKLPILLVLSTHAPTQGQLFSTTPSTYTAKYETKYEGYCEYCSLHDFVVTAQMALGDTLCGIYVSSCFSARLDRSHKDYPVEITWLKNGTLQTELVAPAAEVYYSGSQTADTYVISAFVESAANKKIDEFIKSKPLRRIVNNAKKYLFPDLCDEMKLCYVNDVDISFIVDDTDNKNDDDYILKRKAYDDDYDDDKMKIRKRGRPKKSEINDDGISDIEGNDNDDGDNLPFHEHRVVMSDLIVAFLPINPRDNSIAMALSKNLSIRSDIKVTTVVISIDNAEAQLQAYAESKRLLLVVLDVVPDKSFTAQIKCMEVVSLSKKLLSKSRYPYGMIFLSGMDEAIKRYKTFKSHPAALVVTKGVKPYIWVPLIMYSLHLPVGENGKIITNLATPFSSDTSKKWELEDVVKECQFVCSGMAQETSMQLLSTGNLPPYPIRLKHTPSSSFDEGCDPSTNNIENSVDDIEEPLSLPSSNPPGQTKKEEGEEVTEEIISEKSNAVPEQQLKPPARKRPKLPIYNQKIGRRRRKSNNCKYSDEDLPLSANRNDVQVTHMAIKWDIDFNRSVMYGEIEYHTEDKTENGANEFILDYSMLNIWEVLVIKQDPESKTDDLVPVDFTLTPYSITIKRPSETEKFPKRIIIRFSTEPKGLSVMWRADADGNPCVFTGSCALNNRSIMPCQDAPEAVITYTACVVVPEDFKVIMSAPSVKSLPESEQDVRFKGFIESQRNKHRSVHFFKMDTPLPPSTISIAAGKFDEYIIQGTSVPASIFAPKSLLVDAIRSFNIPLKTLLPKLIEYLGPFPFERSDIVVMPIDFLPLGLQSPNVTFLSQTMITKDGSMSQHLAHELAHNYFGLLISESDWFEMWLSEGFAEYVSERIYLKCIGLTPREQEEHTRIASLMRYQSLLDDIRNTDDSEHTLTSSMPEVGVIKGGMRPVLGTIQYNMGYFILRHLALNVGVNRFDEFLAKYVSHFRNKLLTGRDALDYFFTEFSDKVSPGFSAADMEEWLDSSNICDNLDWKIRSLCSCSKDTNMFLAAIERALHLFYMASGYVVCGKKANADFLCKEIAFEMVTAWDTTMIMLFLSMANESNDVCPTTYIMLERHARFTESNADVRSVFCEIILKNKLEKLYCHVEKLLINDQPMGLYLFSELLCGGKKERKLALSIFRMLNGKQDPQSYDTMLKLLHDYKVIK